jgi:hypothetical protein
MSSFYTIEISPPPLVRPAIFGAVAPRGITSTCRLQRSIYGTREDFALFARDSRFAIVKSRLFVDCTCCFMNLPQAIDKARGKVNLINDLEGYDAHPTYLSLMNPHDLRYTVYLVCVMWIIDRDVEKNEQKALDTWYHRGSRLPENHAKLEQSFIAFQSALKETHAY